MNLLLQIRVPSGPAHGPVPSGAPTVVVLAQPSWAAGEQARAAGNASNASGRFLLLLSAQTELAQLDLVDRRRGAREEVGAARRLRVGDDLADRVVAAQHGRDPVEAEGDPAQRRRPVLERLEQEAEARAGLVSVDPDRVEDLLLDVGAVDTDRPAAELPAV